MNNQHVPRHDIGYNYRHGEGANETNMEISEKVAAHRLGDHPARRSFDYNYSHGAGRNRTDMDIKDGYDNVDENNRAEGRPSFEYRYSHGQGANRTIMNIRHARTDEENPVPPANQRPPIPPRPNPPRNRNRSSSSSDSDSTDPDTRRPRHMEKMPHYPLPRPKDINRLKEATRGNRANGVPIVNAQDILKKISEDEQKQNELAYFLNNLRLSQSSKNKTGEKGINFDYEHEDGKILTRIKVSQTKLNDEAHLNDNQLPKRVSKSKIKN